MDELTKKKQYNYPLILWLSWLLAMPMSASCALLPQDGTEHRLPSGDYVDANEAALALEIIKLGTLPKAEQLLQLLHFKLMFRDYHTVYYTRVRDGQGSCFRLKERTGNSRRLRIVSFETMRNPRELDQVLQANGYTITDHSRDHIGYVSADSLIKAVMTVHRYPGTNILSFSIVFTINL